MDFRKQSRFFQTCGMGILVCFKNCTLQLTYVRKALQSYQHPRRFLIRRASAQWRVRSWTLSFDISPFICSNCFRNFCNRSQLKQPFSSNFSISNCNQLKLGHKFEPQFELELKSNLNSSSSYCFCSRSAHARRRLQEPSDTGIGWGFQVWGPPFLKRFSEWFLFMTIMPNGAPDGIRHVTKSDEKRHLKRSP